jgi:hypothetical protein
MPAHNNDHGNTQTERVTGLTLRQPLADSSRVQSREGPARAQETTGNSRNRLDAESQVTAHVRASSQVSGLLAHSRKDVLHPRLPLAVLVS